MGRDSRSDRKRELKGNAMETTGNRLTGSVGLALFVACLRGRLRFLRCRAARYSEGSARVAE